MITDINEATRQFEETVAEAAAENPEVGVDDVAHDMVLSIAMDCDKATAFELCRRQFGWVHDDVKAFFGAGLATLDDQPEPWLWLR